MVGQRLISAAVDVFEEKRSVSSEQPLTQRVHGK